MPPEAESILVIGCPTKPANLAPVRENSMFCYGPLVSELGGAECSAACARLKCFARCEMTLKSGYVFLYVWHDGIGRNYRQSRIQADFTDLTGFCTRPHWKSFQSSSHREVDFGAAKEGTWGKEIGKKKWNERNFGCYCSNSICGGFVEQL